MVYPVQDLDGFLAGRWRARRRLLDLRSDAEGRFEGTVTFIRESPGRLRCEERGVLYMPDVSQEPADKKAELAGRAVERTSVWVFSGARAEVFFEDGRPFHVLDLSPGRDAPTHWCAPDLYDGNFFVHSPGSWGYSWRVQGPAKDLELRTELERELPVIAVSAVELLTHEGDLVLVRKRGTDAFMQPGGKPEPGENGRQAALRELGEELGLSASSSRAQSERIELEYRGSWRGPTANESGYELFAENYRARVGLDFLDPAAEIEEVRVLGHRDFAAALRSGVFPGTSQRLAPLLLERVLPSLLKNEPTK